jgi:hypothetical protein
MLDRKVWGSPRYVLTSHVQISPTKGLPMWTNKQN